MGWDTTYYKSGEQKPAFPGFEKFRDPFQDFLTGKIGEKKTPFPEPYPTSPAVTSALDSLTRWLRSPEALERPPWAESAIEELVTTGAPWGEGATTYEALKPIFEREQTAQEARLKEGYGMMGGRYGGDILRERRELGRQMAEDLRATLANLSLQAHEGAMGRRVAALPYTTPGADVLPTISSAMDIALAGLSPEEKAWQAKYADFLRTEEGFLPWLMEYAGKFPPLTTTSYAPEPSASDFWPYIMSMFGGE